MPGYVKTGFQSNALAGKPPDKLWRVKKFAITPEQCAEALVRGVERNKRTVVVPRLGWGLILCGDVAGLVHAPLQRIYRELDMH